MTAHKLVVTILACVVASTFVTVSQSAAPHTSSDEPIVRFDVYGDPLPAGATARLGTVRWQHPTTCSKVLFLPGDKQVLSSGGPFTCVWDTHTGKLLQSFGESVASNATGQIVQLGNLNQAISIRQMPSGKVIHRLTITQQEYRPILALSPKAKYLAVGLSDHTIEVYNTNTGERLRILKGHASNLRALVISPDGSRLASMDEVTTVRGRNAIKEREAVWLWDVLTGENTHRFATLGYGGSLCFSPDGRILTCTSSELRLWDTTTGKRLSPVGEATKRSGGTVVFSPDGKTCAVSIGRGVSFLWDMLDKRKLCSLLGPISGTEIRSLVFSHDGKSVVGLASDRQAIVLFDVAGGKQTNAMFGHQAALTCAVPAPRGSLVATASLDGSIRLWNRTNGRQVRCWGNTKYGFFNLMFANKGESLISGHLEPDSDGLFVGKTHRWDIATGKNCEQLSSDRLPWAMSPDENLLALSALQLWDLRKGRVVPFIGESERSAQCIAWAPDGKTLAVAGSKPEADVREEANGIRLLNIATGQSNGLLSHEEHCASALAFSPCGRTLAAGFHGKVQLWDVATRRLTHTIDLTRSVQTIAFSPDGKLLAVVRNYPFGPTLFEVATGEEVAYLEGHQSGVTSVAFFSDAPLLMTSSKDRTALIWDLQAISGGQSVKKSISQKDLTQMWQSLRQAKASEGYQTLCQLAQCPERLASLLSKQFKPVSAEQVAPIRQLIEDLDSDILRVRQRAHSELEKMSPAADLALQEALRNSRSAEIRRRVRSLLATSKLDGQNPDRLHEVRTIQLLELSGSMAARVVLKGLAAGDHTALRTRDAREALRRLAHRVPKPGKPKDPN